MPNTNELEEKMQLFEEMWDTYCDSNQLYGKMQALFHESLLEIASEAEKAEREHIVEKFFFFLTGIELNTTPINGETIAKEKGMFLEINMYEGFIKSLNPIK